MNTPHKHAAFIHAWADGGTIEYRDLDAPWQVRPSPNWLGSGEYRIKPEPKPDDIRYGTAILYWGHDTPKGEDNIKVTFDGETGKLKAAEVL